MAFPEPTLLPTPALVPWLLVLTPETPLILKDEEVNINEITLPDLGLCLSPELTDRVYLFPISLWNEEVREGSRQPGCPVYRGRFLGDPAGKDTLKYILYRLENCVCRVLIR